jgi:hypothetical protein
VIVTATVNGVTVEVSGTPEECAEFLDIFWGDKHMCGKECKANGCTEPVEYCDPFKPHFGNCGKLDCPLDRT